MTACLVHIWWIDGTQTLDPNDKIEEEFIETNYDSNILNSRCPEEFVNVKDEDIVVWVDPLDGTSEYTQGIKLSLLSK